MPFVPLAYVQTALLDFAVNKAPSTALWKVCNECFIMQTYPDPIEHLDWAWIDKVTGFNKSMIN